jgi:FkbM family methyltransferase
LTSKPKLSLPNIPPAAAYRLCDKLGNLERELKYLEVIVPRGGLAIDIGANVGLWCYRLSSHFDRVEAFEPQPRLYHHLEHSNLPGVQLHSCALSSKRGSSVLKIPAYWGLRIAGMATLNELEGVYEEVTVELRTLDEFDFRGVSFIKIDVEGHESDVLAGGQETVRREKPVMVIEIEQRHLSFPFTDVINGIADMGYEAFFLSRGKLHSFAEFDYDAQQKAFTAGMTGKRGTLPKTYINNFIFKPK